MIVGAGTRLQAGIPKVRARPRRNANGMLLPGVVTATYVTDTVGHPYAGAEAAAATAVYCDVLVYPSIGGQRWFGLEKVLVAQDGSGLHKGRIWKPRATTMNFADDLDAEMTDNNPAYLDGDHVLVGFMNDNMSQPVIIRSLPHPSLDLGREDATLGQRMKLVEADGDPDFFRHHGVHWGVADNGDFVVDTTFANDGDLDSNGYEAAPPTGGTGAQTHDLPQDAKFEAVFWDMTDPDSPVEASRFTFQKDKLHVKIATGDSLVVSGKDGDATLVLGDGAVKVAIADHLATLWGQLKASADAHQHTYAAPLIPSGTLVTAPTVPPEVVPAWSTSIESTKAKIPDG